MSIDGKRARMVASLAEWALLGSDGLGSCY